MQTLSMAILALFLLGVAVYAQRQIPRYTQAGAKVMLTRAVLLIAGMGFGLVGAMDFDGRTPQLLAFFIGVGLVHVPAAVILFIKSRRGAGKS